MKLSAEITYPEAGPDAAFAMLTDKAFQERKCAATGALSCEVTIETAADGSVVVLTDRTLPTDPIPEFVRRFVGETVRVTERTVWQPPAADGARAGTLEMEVIGSPVRMTGALRLAAAGAGTAENLDADLKASVPLIGGKVEKAAAPAVQKAISVEERTGRAWLAGDRS